MADWHVGQMVVCVFGGDWKTPTYVTTPVKGCVYTIREIITRREKLGLRLEEITNPILLPPYVQEEPGWFVERFRPVRKTSIDIFRSLLTPSGDDGAATPSRPSRVPSLPDRVEQGSCHYPSLPPCRLPAGGPSLRPTAARLAVQLDGAPLSHSPISPMPKSSSVLAMKHGDDGHGIH